MKARTKKANRETTAKAVARVAGILPKLEVACGRKLMFMGSLYPGASVDLEIRNLQGAIHKVRCLSKEIPDDLKNVSEAQAEQIHKLFYRLGEMMAVAIADRNFALFYRLAAILQYDRQPEVHKGYMLILAYCERHNCGTEAAPCSGVELARFLQRNGCAFNVSYPNEVPRTLRATCKKLGVVLRQR